MRKVNKWESRGPASGILRCLILIGFHLKLQVCQVCWLKSLTLRFTTFLLRLRAEAVRGNGKVVGDLHPPWSLWVIGGWMHKPQCSQANPNPGSWQQALEAYHCLPSWRSEHLAQTSRAAEGSPPATTKAAVTRREIYKWLLGPAWGLSLGFSHPFQCSAV